MSLLGNEPDISILLATLRPDQARTCIESIFNTSVEVDYEIVVVSPLNMNNLLSGCPGYERLKFVQEQKKEGCNKAFSLACAKATGKYVFAMADDSLLDRGCLKNLLEFMRPHDHELFLAGARFHDAYGPGPECTVYGFYYAFNPCIQRKWVEQLGGFYDVCYKSFYGDPDLSLRVWHAGGKVELCPNAWLEFRNEYDDIDFESRRQNAANDFRTFCQRWHPIYCNLVRSACECDINVANNFVLPGIPPAKCTRLLLFLARQDWAGLQSELDDLENEITRENLFYVFRETLNYSPVMPPDVQQNLKQWLISQLFASTSDTATKTTGPIELLAAQQFSPACCDASVAETLLATIAMFVITKGLRRYPELVVSDYKGLRLYYSPRKYYTWPCSAGDFNLSSFQEALDQLTISDVSISNIISRIDESSLTPPLPDLPKIKMIETRVASLFAIDLPPEKCLMLVLALKSKDWPSVDAWLGAEESFVLKNHTCHVYDEVLKHVDQMPSDLLLKLSKWLWEQLT